MNPPIPGWTAVRTTVSVHIPTLDGSSVAQIIPLEVDAWQNADGEIYLTGEVEEQIDAFKAHHITQRMNKREIDSLTENS